MGIRGVLMDFSGTMFRLEMNQNWQQGTEFGELEPLEVEREEQILRAMTAPVEPTVGLPPDLREDWARRDFDPEVHRRVSIAVLQATGLAEFDVANAFYDRLIDAGSWQPYPDTRAALERLRAARVPIAVVSNISWDIRRVFDRHGLTDLVDEFVLSYLEGVVKPDPKIFQTACERLGLRPEETLMIGDSAEADGAAAAIGASVAIVPPLPTKERPNALLDALTEHGVAARTD
ncbi:MAG TPA: HAD-IA family hydrolase [Pseudonocardiaceae bacterium]|jgi:HAD superfamily hydrolase (TIGR01509 family)|nr:HAD-IA family hydrolase [Pseudonocardiaceae bacterium]